MGICNMLKFAIQNAESNMLKG